MTDEIQFMLLCITERWIEVVQRFVFDKSPVMILLATGDCHDKSLFQHLLIHSIFISIKI